MPSAGPRFPTAAANDASSSGPTWTNPANVEADDGSYATVVGFAGNGAPTTEYLKATGFGFAVPGGATILGIKVEINRHAVDDGFGGSHGSDSSVKLAKAGTIGGTDHAAGGVWPGSDAVQSYGGPTDLWGQTWTPADINAAGFGAALAGSVGGGNGGTLFVDSMRITVYHSAPTGLTMLM